VLWFQRDDLCLPIVDAFRTFAENPIVAIPELATTMVALRPPILS
jgi:hypothetical protein